MRKLVTAASATLLAAGLGAIAPIAGSTSAGATDAAPDDDSAAATRQYVNQHTRAVHGTPADSYRVTEKLESGPGAAVRYERTYRGLPVLGGDFVVRLDAQGRADGVSVAQDRPISVSTDPSVPKARAAHRARAGATSTSIRRVGDPRLVVDARKGRAELAWRTVVRGMQADDQTPSRQIVVTDARTDTVRSVEETITTPVRIGRHADQDGVEPSGVATNEVGTGHGIFIGDVEIDTTPTTNGFELVDPSHGNGNACDMHNRQFGCETFTDADNVWGDGTQADRASAGVDAHYGAATTFDYFEEIHDRNGIFDDGTGVPSRVHYGNNYINAFWDGRQMTYGDGANNQNPLVALDIAAHEMSHGVTENTAGLAYTGDAGGLNESTSDIFATLVEFYADNPSDTPDFTIGEMIDINGDGTPLRYMDDPSRDGRSFSCWTEEVPASDPHFSSGVGNHFFFLLANGSGSSEYGDSPTCDGSVVTGIGHEKAGAIWFKALTEYMTSTETYAQARDHTVRAATDLYGTNSPEVQATEAAWSAVSVG